MINIKSKEYNLSALFQYDLLRDILLSLADYQNEIRSELEALKNQNKIQDFRLSLLEEKNDINPQEFNINVTNIKSSKNFENINNIQNQQAEENTNENKENNKIEGEKEEENKEEKKEEGKDDEKKEEGKDNEKNKEKKEGIIKEEENKNNTKIDFIRDEGFKKITGNKKRKKLSTRFPNLINDNFIADYSATNSPQSQKNSEINLELIRDMMENIRENSEKISNFESDIDKQIDKQLTKATSQFKKDILNEMFQNKSSFNNLDNRVKEIMQKSEEQDKIIEDLTVKSANFDIFKMFQDNGDGNVDMTKMLVKALEEKVFKKFEIIDLRYKQEAGELLKAKRSAENLVIIGEKNDREINDLKEEEKKLNEEIENLKSLIKNNDKKYEELFEEKENNYIEKIEELEKELKKKIQDIKTQMEENMENRTNIKRTENEEEEINSEQNKYDEEIINNLERKFGDLRKKTNDLDNTFKLFIKDLDIEQIKKNIKDLKFELDQKLTKDSLKELYNLHLSDVDEINDLRDHIALINEDSKKNSKNITTLTNKMELVLGNLISLKENNPGTQKPELDLTGFVESDTFYETLKKYNRNIEKIFEELESLRRDLTEIQIINKDLEKKDRIDRLEEDIYIQINERKNNSIKNKNDLLKQIKTLEVQVKALKEEMKQKQDADSWILAKQPMKCFNCATCEANIKNGIPSEEYISWNRYPPSNKNDNNRFGRGFSHMLQMMTSDLINNVDNITNMMDNKEKGHISSAQGENTKKNNLINSTNYNENSKYNFMTKIATVERNSSFIMNKINKRDIGKSSVPKNLGKLKLPKMYETNKKTKGDDSGFYLDEEKNNNGNEHNETINSYDNDNTSPKIIKITKKTGNKNNTSVNSPSKITYNLKNNIKPPSTYKRNSRVNMIDINKNFAQTNPIP